MKAISKDKIKASVHIVLKFLAMVMCIAVTASVFTACGKSTAERNTEKPQMNIDFENGQTVRKGTEQRFYQVEEGQKGELKISVDKKSGRLNISVFPVENPDKLYYCGKDIPTSDFTVELSDSGEYKVSIEADAFVGDYGFEWSIQN